MSTYLDSLPEIEFANKSVAEIQSEIISAYETLSGEILYGADPKRLLLLTFIKYLAMQRNRIDYAGKQNLLKYAGEGFLQNIAALVDTEILESSAAITTLKFTLSTTLPSGVAIKKGTRVTAGDQIYFATTDDVEIPPGELSCEVQAICTQTGVIGNGYRTGRINILVDPFPYHCSVENMTVTQGGADREDLEAFRERVRIAPESFSTAGPIGAYEFWAKSASQLIADVSVTSPSPVVVEIVPLLENGEIPTQTILDAVYAECNDERRRPFTDKVIVRAPEVLYYNLSLKYYISRKDASVGLSIQNKVNEAVQRFILWQKSALGRDLNPSKLNSFLMETGIKRVEILEPVFTVTKYYQVAVADVESINVVYGGLEDD